METIIIITSNAKPSVMVTMSGSLDSFVIGVYLHYLLKKKLVQDQIFVMQEI